MEKCRAERFFRKLPIQFRNAVVDLDNPFTTRALVIVHLIPVSLPSANKQYDLKQELSHDISKYVIDMTDPSILESQIKFNALRALCKHEREWDTIVWPAIKEDTIEFIMELNNRFGGNCQTLVKLTQRLKNMERGHRFTSFKKNYNCLG